MGFFGSIGSAIGNAATWAFHQVADHPLRTAAVVGGTALALTGVGAVAGGAAVAGVGLFGRIAPALGRIGSAVAGVFKTPVGKIAGTGIAVGVAGAAAGAGVKAAGDGVGDGLKNAFGGLNPGIVLVAAAVLYFVFFHKKGRGAGA